MNISGWGHLFAAAAAIGAGIINSIAGGGTLLSFPILSAIGVPSVGANATSTVALCPGHLGGVHAQRRDLGGQFRAARSKTIMATLGGFAGSVCLIVTSDATFRSIVPYLIVVAVVLLTAQDRMRTWLAHRARPHDHGVAEIIGLFLAGLYGGYFGAGLGIMLLAVLGLFSDITFNKLNAMKQVLAFLINSSAAIFLAFTDKVSWSLVLVMAPAALLGGTIGGRVVRILPPARMRRGVIVLGLIVATIYFVR
ncbi:MAG: sulfite exporter TauE/SafE family protein [Acidimicrobiia bacterium]